MSRGRRGRRSIGTRVLPRLLLAAIAGTLALGAAPAHAIVTYVADPAADGDDVFPGDGQCMDALNPLVARCSLRAAIEESNALPLNQRIELQPATYRPATPLPAISSDMEIVGKGAGHTSIDAGGKGRALLTSGATVTVSDLTLTGGVLTAGAGAGLRNAGADVTLLRVAVVGNVLRPLGDARGGGIDNSSGTLDIVASLIAGNRAEPAAGADGDAFGGGIASSSPMSVVETTVHGNIARPSDGRGAAGGGIAIGAGVTELRHVTFSDNLADKGGNGGNLDIGGTTVLMRDSVLVGGSDGNGPENCAGQPPQTLPWNIDSGTTCGLGGGNYPNTDPLLAPFGPHGGETNSRPPLQESLAVGGAGDCSAGKDQRGTALGPACDFGAVERVTDAAAAITASRSPVPAGGELTIALSASSRGWDPVVATNALLALPAGVTLLSSDAPGGSCLTLPGPPVSVSCQLGPPGPGQVMSVTVRVPASGPLTFTGTVTGDIGESFGANDSASVTVPVLPPPPAAQAPIVKTTAKNCARTLRGTRRADRMIGGSGSDRMLGGRGADTIEGRGGDDCLYGQDGGDTLTGGDGRDTLSGGAGNDTIKARDGKRDTITCGKGRDRVTADRLDRIARDCETRRRS